MEAHSVPLTYEERRVIDDSRYSIVRPQVKDWNLLIRDVRKEDAGDYLCTINTYPVRTKLVTLYVIGIEVTRVTKSAAEFQAYYSYDVVTLVFEIRRRRRNSSLILL